MDHRLVCYDPHTKDLLNQFPFKFCIQPKKGVFQLVPASHSGPMDSQILKRLVLRFGHSHDPSVKESINIVVL